MQELHVCFRCRLLVRKSVNEESFGVDFSTRKSREPPKNVHHGCEAVRNIPRIKWQELSHGMIQNFRVSLAGLRQTLWYSVT